MTDPTPTPETPATPREGQLSAEDFADAEQIAQEWMRGKPFPSAAHNLVARAYLALRSPVPAEATSGADAAVSVVEKWKREFQVREANRSSDQYGMDAAFVDRKQEEVCDLILARLAALRTPPAPLPREGATVTEKDVAMLREVVEHDACAWMPPYREAVQRILAALTPAAQPTTKETR